MSATPSRPTAVRGPVLTFTGDPFRDGLDKTMVHEPDAIVAIISGHGLKTLDAIVDTATVSSTISPSLVDAEEALRFHQLVAAS